MLWHGYCLSGDSCGQADDERRQCFWNRGNDDPSQSRRKEGISNFGKSSGRLNRAGKGRHFLGHCTCSTLRFGRAKAFLSTAVDR